MIDEISPALAWLESLYGEKFPISGKTLTELVKHLSFYNYDTELYLETVIFYYKNKHHGFKNFSPEEFIDAKYCLKYHQFLELAHKAEPDVALRYIRRSAVKIKKFMVENKFRTFNDYLNFGIEIYPVFMDHKRNGKLNNYLLTFADPDDIIIGKIAPDIKEMFMGDYLEQKDGMRIKIATNNNLEDELTAMLVYLNMEETHAT